MSSFFSHKTVTRPRHAALGRKCPAAPAKPIHCTQCGHTLIRRFLPKESRERLLCSRCAYVHYENPRVLVACVVTCGDHVLLCRRALEPAYGLWAPPAGFLENGETLEDAAVREVQEEAGVQVIGRELVLRGITCLPNLDEVYIHFSASVDTRYCLPGVESLDARFFTQQALPWAHLAFPSIAQDLRLFFHERAAAGAGVRVACEQ